MLSNDPKAGTSETALSETALTEDGEEELKEGKQAAAMSTAACS